MSICSNLWQVGGAQLTDPADAAAYLVRFGDHAALIDAGCGFAHDRLMTNIRRCLPAKVQLTHLLLTHCHFDHSGGAVKVKQECGCKIVAHRADAVYLEAGDDGVTAASWYGAHMAAFQLTGIRHTLDIGDGQIEALHCPGHSPGSLVYTTRMDGRLILFGQDVHGPIHPALLSDERQYQQSLDKMAALDADLLLEGHFGVIEGRQKVRRFIQSYKK